MSYEVVQNVVRLFYFREIFVPNDLKEKMVEALKFLRTFDINVLEEGKRSEAMKSKHFIHFSLQDFWCELTKSFHSSGITSKTSRKDLSAPKYDGCNARECPEAEDCYSNVSSLTFIPKDKGFFREAIFKMKYFRQVEASSQNGASMNAVNAIGRNFSQMNIQKAKPKIVNTATVPIAMAIQQKKGKFEKCQSVG